MYKLLALKRLQTPGTQAPTTRFSLSFVSFSSFFDYLIFFLYTANDTQMYYIT